MHDVAGALVGGEVVEGTPVGGLADAGFLGAVAPLDDVVAGAEAGHGAEVIAVGLAGVAGVRLGETEEVGAAAAQVARPHPERRAEFGVVPGVAAPVVVPDVAGRGIGVHEIAELPEAVPGAVVDLTLVVGEHGVEAVFDGPPEGGGAVGESPGAEDAGGVDVLRRGGEQRELGAGGGHGNGVGLGGEGGGGEEGELAGAGDSVGGAEAGLRVFVGGVETVAMGVVEAHIHLGGVGRPEPGDDLCGGAGGVLDLERGGERLPEVLDADGEAAAEIAGVSEAGSALAGGGIEPGAGRAGALEDGEAVGVGLDELEVVPDGVLGKRRAAGEGLAGLLRGAAAAGLERLGPETAVRAGETDGAVAGLVAHGHVELEAEAANEVLVLVAIEDDGVDDADGSLASVEVETHGEGQPLTMRDGAAMLAFDLDDGADGTLLLDGDVRDGADVALAAGRVFRVVRGAALQNADELADTGDGLAGDAHRGDEVGAGERDGALERTGVDEDLLAVVPDGEGGADRSRAGEQRERALKSGGENAGEAGPLDGAVGPVGERPGLEWEGLGFGGEAEGCLAGDAALWPRDSPTDAGGDCGWILCEPGKSDPARDRGDSRALSLSGSGGEEFAFGEGGECGAGECGILQEFAAGGRAQSDLLDRLRRARQRGVGCHYRAWRQGLGSERLRRD